jgi:hypothetical protein
MVDLIHHILSTIEGTNLPKVLSDLGCRMFLPPPDNVVSNWYKGRKASNVKQLYHSTESCARFELQQQLAD